MIHSRTAVPGEKPGRRRARVWLRLGEISFVAVAAIAPAHAASSACTTAGIGSITLRADAKVTITSVTAEHAGTGASSVKYCLVKVHVPQAVNIWVGLPMEDKWNGRLRSEGNGGYAGVVTAPTLSVLDGYAGVRSDGGHAYTAEDLKTRAGDFAMLAPGVPNLELQRDFAFRAPHLMTRIGKQLVSAFYGRDPEYSYWYGCSEGGREGLRLAQDFPDDYDGILAGAPAIYLGQLAAYHIWPQVVMKDMVGYVIPARKQELATRSAVAACDAIDGVTDGLITDPRKCSYQAKLDQGLTRTSCTATNDMCLTPQEAEAIDRIWQGPSNTKREILWPGIERGAQLGMLAGPKPFLLAITQPRYWIHLDPTWDWRVLTLENYEEYFDKAVRVVNPLLGSSNPDLSAFSRRGGKMISWHGFNDWGIMPRNSLIYYENVVQFMGDYASVQRFYRLFMAPGVEHCRGGDAPQPQESDLFQALVDWVERGQAPDRIVASQPLPEGSIRTRPVCPYPKVARFSGKGSSDDERNFFCADDDADRPGDSPPIMSSGSQ